MTYISTSHKILIKKKKNQHQSNKPLKVNKKINKKKHRNCHYCHLKGHYLKDYNAFKDYVANLYSHTSKEANIIEGSQQSCCYSV